MKVFVLHRYFDTPDIEGNEIMGVYRKLEDAQSDMHTDVASTREYHEDDFWDDDMTWEDELEVHLGHNPKLSGCLATIYCWEIKETHVQ